MTPEAPYASPTAKLTEPEEPRPGSQIKAVLVGVGVDIFGTFAASVVISMFYGVIWALRGLPAAQIEQAIQQSSQFSPGSTPLTRTLSSKLTPS